ncbi:MAG: exodeoxyribonuclease V subunit gamma, partial [Pasteurella oralis]|nr:exodeoxyribonuclease V subunit gamma [Pasteurella oralis]
SGLTKENPEWVNYNSWQNGLERLLLGVSLKSENNPWQNTIAFNQSYGLSAELTGKLAKFIEQLTDWVNFIQKPQLLADWQTQLKELIQNFYHEESENNESLFSLYQAVEMVIESIEQTGFNSQIDIEVLAQIFVQQFNDQRSNLNFLVGKVNFCTLLPMRAIPFKVVCLLGMNEGDFPRQQMLNNFDLMQYAPQKGDRAKRDDDRYLFLEALLSAQQVFYISYIGQSLTDSSEKLPSILVSQLIDYLKQGLNVTQYPIIQHSMTVFSQKNLHNHQISYDKEWINAKSESSLSEPFIQSIHHDTELPPHIDLNELIAYIQSPMKWYFNCQLGIRFDENESSIEDAEPFTLSGLEKYQLLDELLNVDLSQNQQFFENAKLQGELPANHFAKISQDELNQSIKLLREILSDYLSQESELIEFKQEFEIGSQKINVIGNIHNKFGENIIQWRVGGLKDKHLIQSWIYYLALCAMKSEIKQFRFYYRQGNEAKYLTFNPISPEEAKQQLTGYLQDYLASFKQLRWAVTETLEDNNFEKTFTLEECQNRILASDDVYIQRVLAQNNELDYTEIHQRTLEWFALMHRQINQ